MRLLVAEYLAGGGMADHPLPERLKQEGLLMLRSVLMDCLRIHNLHLVTTLDSRVRLGLPEVESITVKTSAAYIGALAGLARQCDAAWIIAPESDRRLGSIVARLADENIQLINCDQKSIAVCSDKLNTETRLLAAGLPAVKSLSKDALASFTGRVVVKDRYGLGCEGLRIYPCGRCAASRLHEADALIAQPCIQGDHLSLSLLCRLGRADVLSVNIQKFSGDEQPKLIRCMVNAMPVGQEFTDLAQRIAESLPGLKAYVGVDLIRNRQGSFIVDINPRVTSSYAGLRQVLALNPAQLCLQAALNETSPIQIKRNHSVAEVCFE